ncbi:DNA adenine methylase [[Clostridium] scindens]|uniref:DNA adenine methylase n=1 Tax=Lachnospiraceae TaxID=186803 RepID=UPI003992C46C
MKAIMKYPGSKWSIADWIISYFPQHHSYIEPFFGSGAVLFNKPRSNIETVNDLDGNVVNLFEWIRKDPERLAREIYYTPYARQVYDSAFESVPEDSFGRAVNFYIRLNMGHGFRTNGEDRYIRLCIPSDYQNGKKGRAGEFKNCFTGSFER